MGFHNPPMPWADLERTLSDRPFPPTGIDVPYSRKRGRYRPPPVDRPTDPVPYAELHAHSSFSFLDGASAPADLVVEAERLGLSALALTDHDGLYGITRFAEAAEPTKVRTVFGAELSLELTAPQNGRPDPEGSHLLVLAAGEEGYHRLARAITHAQLTGAEKGRPVYDPTELADAADGHWTVLTGCRKGAVRQGLRTGGAVAAGRELDALVDLFGRERVYVELTDHGHPLDSTDNDALAALAADRGLPTLATGNVHYATPAQHRLAQTVAAIRANRSLDDLDGWLPAAGTAFLRSGAEMNRLFARYPGAVERTVELADELAFPLRRAKPALPRQEVPEGHTQMSWLRELVHRAIPERYPRLDDAGRARIERELAVIEAKDFPGYFLIVHDIVAEAHRRGILCQGRGSAANSAVCYLLGITAVDSIRYDLPFERFLSALRDEEPDIDVDFDSDRREEIIQWVFDRYGRERAAQVCNVIQYRPKNAIRDVAKALGYSPGQQDAFARQADHWSLPGQPGQQGSPGQQGRSASPGQPGRSRGSDASAEQSSGVPQSVLDLADQLLKAPRHLGIHSAGMVLTERPVGEVVPIEHARMPGRTVIQWDKDDAAWMGLVKFDLLGLGMLAALQHSFTLIRDGTGEDWGLASIPKEEQEVYDMLCRADAIGVFQVESRAQMGLLPRLRPRRFYDLVIEIALIRPGPIQGGAVHPFVRRKLGQEPVTYAHPKLEPVLKRTLGVPIFQEQLMQMAMAVGECSGEDADLLRRAMGSKRGIERIDSLKKKLYDGMAGNGLVGPAADHLYAQIQAFANFGFAESHSLSFALLVYASSWLKLHYPAAFLAGLLRAQPMGFYSPATLTADARRHGVEVRRPDLRCSGVDAGLEPLDPGPLDPAPLDPGPLDPGPLDPGPPQGRRAPTGLDSCLDPEQPPVGEYDPAAPDTGAEHRRDGNLAVRLGLAGVRGIGRTVAGRIVAARDADGPYASLEDLTRRAGLTEEQLSALATAGAFDGLGLTRRQALWRAGTAALDQAGTLPGLVTPLQPPLFGPPTGLETLADDLWATGISTTDHLLAHLRARLDEQGVLTSAAARAAEAGRRVRVAGLVTHRQRPSSASGITFVNLEDEHGMVNVICSAGVWTRYRRLIREARGLIVRGILERSAEGVTNLVADHVEPLPVTVRHTSRDFH
ncbi:error-prone DNA polymerase [Raineyella sp. LH-20]|uniref:error-prone DNA polymerase n=1 Tax=Raineyella sp. LH-20 TaxID=3081204 RepID=UPI0029541D20|nr:error-prone DNA polymerase [Raineyella sp. LH-20]WOP17562.1 error-prone DNA polymerase [Raineyella sp. LH-20]